MRAAKRRGAIPKPAAGSQNAATRGYLDVVRNGLVAGWVMRPHCPSDAMKLVIKANQVSIAEVVANTYREDVAGAGIGTGRYGFTVTGASAVLPPAGCLVTVEDAATGCVVLSGSVLPIDGRVQGHVDAATFQALQGWVWRPDQPQEAVTVRVCADGNVIARAVANIYRADVERAGFGTGRYGFDLTGNFNPPLGSCLITVEDDATGTALANSPVRLEAPLELGGSVEAAMTALFESPGTDDDLRARAEYAARQADRLIQRLSESRSRRTDRTAQRRRKWRWRPEDGPEPAHLPARVMVIDQTMPCHGRDAGSNAILSHLASLRRLGFDILFVPADMRPGPGMQALHDLGIACVTEPWCASVEEVMRREGAEFDLVYLHRIGTADRYITLARHHMPRARRLYSVADLHGLRLARQGEVEERPELVAHARFVHQTEMAAAAGCHMVVTHSPAEAEILRRSLPPDRVQVVPWHVPLCATTPSFAERSGIAFIGNFAHAPNLDAAVWLRDVVMPLVWAAEPGIACTVAGTDMPRLLSAPQDLRFQAVGRIESLSGLLSQVRLTVAPLAFGAGLKGKVLDSLAMGVPCVCTPIAAEGLDLPSPLRDLVAADPAGLAASIVRLHRDAALFAACRAAGLAYVSAGFSEAVVDAGLRRAAGLPSSLGAGHKPIGSPAQSYAITTPIPVLQ